MDITKTITLAEAKTAKLPLNFDLEKLPVKRQDRYKFLRTIGVGGMKVVLLVHDEDTRRDIAMAIMPDFRERPKADLERFVHEATLTAQLEHPNIVPVHDIGVDVNGAPFFTMKYLSGQSLNVLLGHIRAEREKVHEAEMENRRPERGEYSEYTLSRMLNVFLRVCNAIGFAHNQHVCHLDLKPGNIHIGQYGEVQVIDWGLARQTDANGKVVGGVGDAKRGTPGFVAPELYDNSGHPVTTSADIYALGALLYSLLTLSSPLAGCELNDILAKCAAGEVPPPSEVVKESWSVPRALEAVAMKAMSPDPKDRYASVNELKNEIVAFRNGFAPMAEQATKLKKFELFLGRHFAMVIIAMLTLMVISLLVILRHIA